MCCIVCVCVVLLFVVFVLYCMLLAGDINLVSKVYAFVKTVCDACAHAHATSAQYVLLSGFLSRHCPECARLWIPWLSP